MQGKYTLRILTGTVVGSYFNMTTYSCAEAVSRSWALRRFLSKPLILVQAIDSCLKPTILAHASDS